MKRKVIASIVTLALGALLVPVAFAASDNNQANPAPTAPSTQNQQFIDQMFENHKDWLDYAVKNKQLTEEQAKDWTQHFEQMKEFHSQYGMGPGMMGNGAAGCPGIGNSNGFGPGMMGNFNAFQSK
ncbi:hypothetical protein JCM14036_31170 [Desulfotomaculum defluvii]